jgi:hypothetical protein
MIRVVKSIDAYHTDYVADEVECLQSRGFVVTDIKRIQRMFLFFGEDVSYIYYERKNK